MGKTLYLECTSGISGDMAVAALLDVGASEDAVRAALASLPVDGFEVRIGRVVKSGLDVCDFDVVLDAAHENHDHDMAYLHGPAPCAPGHDDAPASHAHDSEAPAPHAPECAPAEAPHAHGDASAPHVHAHVHGDAPHAHVHGDAPAPRAPECAPAEAPHAHAHDDGPAPRACARDSAPHVQGHRGMAEISAILEAAALTDGARALAQRIFAVIAQAEAEAHGVPVDQVHFHEVGAADSIADIVAAAVALDDLAAQGIDEVVVTELVEGRGTVRCQHGIIPVPVPAVVNIARAAGLPLRLTAVEGELVTPTGAAIAVAARTRAALPERFTVERVGMGAGKRAYDTPGILRALVIEEA